MLFNTNTSINTNKVNKEHKVNIYNKHVFANLLAKENMTIVHDPSAKTAYIGTDRVITLPVLKDMTGYMYDVFLSHEISHALHTPLEECKEFDKNFFTFVNITEDARIEKLIQKKFPGLTRQYKEFYTTIHNKEYDFFGIHKDNLDISKLSLIDRINLEFKIGGSVDIPFSKEEEYFVNLVENEITFDDAVNAAQEIWDHMEKNGQIQEIKQVGISISGNSGEAGEEDSPQNGDGVANSDDCGDDDKTSAEDGDSKYDVGVTQESFESGKETMQQDQKSASKTSMHSIDNTTFSDVISKVKINSNFFGQEEYFEFRKKTKNILNSMVSRFNSKKSADEFQKKKSSISGKLNPKKLPLYQIRDDLFLSSETFPDAENHGFMILVDWSGSMTSCIKQTVKQLTIIIEFCNRLNMPFSVYGFTSKSSLERKHQNALVTSGCDSAVIFEIVSSTMTRNKINITLSALLSKDMEQIHTPGGTPLVTASLAFEHHIKSFIMRHGRQKNNVVVITDGGSSDYIKNNGGRIILQDRETLKNIEFGNNRTQYLDVFGYFKQKYNLNSLIGFYITGTFNADYINRYMRTNKLNDDENKLKHEFFNDGAVNIGKDKHFDDYIIVDPRRMNEISKIKEGLSNVPSSPEYLTPSSANALQNKKIEQAIKNINTKSLKFLNVFIDIVS